MDDSMDDSDIDLKDEDFDDNIEANLFSEHLVKLSWMILTGGGWFSY